MARKLTAAFAAMLLLVLGLAACQKKTAEKAGEQAAPPRTDAVSWVGYTEGMKKAKETGKPAMVDFYTTWCKY
ncbi:MAG TPA: hypothetical protein VJM83_03445, partial [Nitrospirota bacterium]|nr:hypothetical protein [Nitrospirota bacterium]